MLNIPSFIYTHPAHFYMMSDLNLSYVLCRFFTAKTCFWNLDFQECIKKLRNLQSGKGKCHCPKRRTCKIGHSVPFKDRGKPRNMKTDIKHTNVKMFR